MAALSSFHALVSRVASQRALVFAITPRGVRRRSTHLAATAARVAAVAGEIVLFLWMALALAFSLLVMAGFLL